jgi:hypothetical protein
MSPTDRTLTAFEIMLSKVLIFALGVAGVVCGIRSTILARNQRPKALAFAGIFTGAIGLVCWLMVMVTSIAVLSAMQRR